MALQAATAAPSLLNSQPWIVAANDDTVLVRADRSRRLFVHDPRGREMRIACGSHTLYAETALRAQGLCCHVQHLPDRAQAPDIIAVLHISTTEPHADPDPQTQRLAAVVQRALVRSSPFTGAAVDDVCIRALCAAAEAEVAWMRTLDDDRRIEAAVLHTHADESLRTDPHAIDELARWVRNTDTYDDGVSPHDAGSDVSRGLLPATWPVGRRREACWDVERPARAGATPDRAAVHQARRAARRRCSRPRPGPTPAGVRRRGTQFGL